MWISLALVLAIIWLVCFVGFHVASAGIHLLLVLAVIALFAHVASGSTSRSRPV